MSRRKNADEKLVDLDKQIDQQRAKLVELNQQRAAVVREQRKANNMVVLQHVDALLCFASHTFKDCEEGRPYKNPNCPRCRLLTAKEDGYMSDGDEWSVSIQFTEHEDPDARY